MNEMLETAINNIATTYFGNVIVIGLALIALFVVVCVSIGLGFETSLLLSLPIVLAIVAQGLLSGYGWIGDAVLVIIGLAYGFLLIRMLNQG